ncbi:MAG: ECF transporter S component [Candidatus Lokiarchaeota archaeon]|nr:ECF transporter S component [Candidatus Lokiarchaeota archaeon]
MATSKPETRVEDTTNQKKKYSLVIKISGGAIFSAISLVISLLTTEFLPRFAWGLAWFDPVSVIWILSFFVFGYEAGILTSVIGMFLLFPFDPFAPFGPIFKFTATIPLIIVPYIIEKIRKHPINNTTSLKTKYLAFNWIFSVIIRLVLMVPLNVIAMLTIYSDFQLWNTHTLAFLWLDSIDGWTAIVITVIFANVLQSIFDYVIPSAIIKPIQLGIPHLIQW